MPLLDRSLIQTLPAFSGMSDAELDNVIAHARAQRISKGSAVFQQGEIAKYFFVLLHGRLKVVKLTPFGQQMIVRFVNPGEIYGIARALRREDYPASAIAVVDSVTLVWPTEVWDSFIAAHPTFAANVMGMMGQTLQEAHTRLKELSTEEVELRVAHTLLRLIARSGRKIEGGVLVDFPITQQDIAEASGTTLHTVSRILSGWESAGLVSVERRKIIVCDAQGLSTLAERGSRNDHGTNSGSG